MLEQQINKMYQSIDDSVGVEEVLDVHSPEIVEQRYKSTKTDSQRLWNVALRKLVFKLTSFSGLQI
jgi:hypothetical protein